MQSNKELENEPTVGNGFFENLPPVGKTNCLRPLRKFNGVKQATATSIPDRKFQKPKTVLKAPETIFVKGFGEMPLFVLGMVTKAEAAGEHVRLDDDTGKNGRLLEAEQICKRNSTMVRKLHKEEQLENSDNTCDANEDELVSIDFPDETLASDCSTKTGNYNVRKQTESFRRGGEV